MEISDKKRAANQANGRKSHGPKTPEGKRNSSRNATRHGMLADMIVIEGESRERFIKFYKSLTAELAPHGLAEELLVEKIVIAQWRLKRLWTVECAGISREIRNLPGDMAKEDTPTRAYVAMRILAENGGRADIMNLYEHRFDSIQHRAFEALMRHQHRRLSLNKRTHQVDENKGPAPETEPTENPCETQ